MRDLAAEQAEYWNGKSGQRWASERNAFDRNLALIHAALMPFAAAQSGEFVLDIGCGAGSTTFELARAVGPKGRVSGIDISRPLIELAQDRALTEGVRAGFSVDDAAIAGFLSDHHLVFSRFGLMFFAEPEGALANIKKALRPGGRIAFVCWRNISENLWASSPFAVAKPFLPQSEPPDLTLPGPFAFSEEARLTSLMQGAGYRDLELHRLDTVMDLGDTIAEATAQATSLGPLARASVNLDDATRAKIREVVAKRLEEYATPQGVRPPAACWLVRAKA